MLTIPTTAHVFPLESVPLVPHPALSLVPHQLGDDLGVEEPDLDVHQQPEHKPVSQITEHYRDGS